MANATAKVNKGTVRWTDLQNMRRSSATLAAITQFYVGAALGTTTGGYLAKFDDTQALELAGFVQNDHGNPKLPVGTAGDDALMLEYERPRAFALAISGVAVTDIGRRVYALDDQTGTLSASATTYANVYGKVIDIIATGIALVEPQYAVPRNNPLIVMSANGAVPAIRNATVLLTKAGVLAATIGDPTTGVHDGIEMTFISTTAQAHTLSNAAGSGFNGGGAASDVGTFGGAKGDGITIVAYGGVWYVKAKTNVTLA